MPKQLPSTEITNEMIKKVAICAATGATVNAISTETGISRHLIRKIMFTPKFKEELRVTTDEVTSQAKTYLRAEISKLSHEVFRVISDQLREKNSLEAVKIALKIMGFENEEEKKQGDTNIVVKLPGQVSLKDVANDIEVSNVQDDL